MTDDDDPEEEFSVITSKEVVAIMVPISTTISIVVTVTVNIPKNPDNDRPAMLVC